MSSRRWGALTVLPLASLLASCGGPSPTGSSSTPAPRAPSGQAFTGTIRPGGSVSHAFTAAGAGQIEITLTGLDPGTASVGLAVGLETTGRCSEFTSLPDAKVGDSLAGWVVENGYCAVVFDTGALAAPASYRLTVAAPESGP